MISNVHLFQITGAWLRKQDFFHLVEKWVITTLDFDSSTQTRAHWHWNETHLHISQWQWMHIQIRLRPYSAVTWPETVSWPRCQSLEDSTQCSQLLWLQWRRSVALLLAPWPHSASDWSSDPMLVSDWLAHSAGCQPHHLSRRASTTSFLQLTEVDFINRWSIRNIGTLCSENMASHWSIANPFPPIGGSLNEIVSSPSKIFKLTDRQIM